MIFYKKYYIIYIENKKGGLCMSYYDEFARGSIYDDWYDFFDENSWDDNDLGIFPSVYDDVDFPDEAELPF